MALAIGRVVVFDTSKTSLSRAASSFSYSSASSRRKVPTESSSPASSPVSGSPSVRRARLCSHSQRMLRRISPVAMSSIR